MYWNQENLLVLIVTAPLYPKEAVAELKLTNYNNSQPLPSLDSSSRVGSNVSYLPTSQVSRAYSWQYW